MFQLCLSLLNFSIISTKSFEDSNKSLSSSRSSYSNFNVTNYSFVQFNGLDWSLLVKPLEIEDIQKNTNQELCLSSIYSFVLNDAFKNSCLCFGTVFWNNCTILNTPRWPGLIKDSYQIKWKPRSLNEKIDFDGREMSLSNFDVFFFKLKSPDVMTFKKVVKMLKIAPPNKLEF